MFMESLYTVPHDEQKKSHAINFYYATTIYRLYRSTLH